MAISPLKPPPSHSRRSLPGWAINVHCLVRNCLTVINCSSVMSPLLVADQITITQPPSTCYVSLAMNDHVAAPHLHCCKITISSLSLYRGATNFVLSVAATLCLNFPLPTLLFHRFCFCCVIPFFFLGLLVLKLSVD